MKPRASVRLRLAGPVGVVIGLMVDVWKEQAVEVAAASKNMPTS